MNNLAFLVRGPLLLALTGIGGLHYVLANVISLCADRRPLRTRRSLDLGPGASDQRALRHPRPGHGRIGGRAARARALPRRRSRQAGVDPCRDRTTRQDRATRATPCARTASRSSPTARPFREASPCGRAWASASYLGQSARAPLAPRPLHQFVEPVLRWHFAEQGIALVHAACIAVDDRAFLITARTDTGKTTTILRLLDSFPRARVHLRRPDVHRPGRNRRVVPEAADDQPAHAARGPQRRTSPPPAARPRRAGATALARGPLDRHAAGEQGLPAAT